MANSDIIRKAKNKIITEFIQDKEIIEAMDIPEILVPKNKPSEAFGKAIFDFNQPPNTIKESMCFMSVLLNMPEAYRNQNDMYVKPRVIINIWCEIDHMRVKNIPKVTSNRVDYLSYLIDNKINGREDLGIKQLVLIKNEEKSYWDKWLMREIVFEGLDFNNSLCD